MKAPLKIYTAFASYRASDKLDISRKSATEGLIFAPTWRLLNPFLSLRKGVGLRPEDWAAYTEGYKAEMRDSYRENKEKWQMILGRSELTLTCYCKLPEQCHRTICGRDILAHFGAVFIGERQDVLL